MNDKGKLVSLILDVVANRFADVLLEPVQQTSEEEKPQRDLRIPRCASCTVDMNCYKSKPCNFCNINICTDCWRDNNHECIKCNEYKHRLENKE